MVINIMAALLTHGLIPILNAIQILNHSKYELHSTIQIPNVFGIQATTVYCVKQNRCQVEQELNDAFH